MDPLTTHTIAPGREPFEVFVLVLGLLVGSPLLFGGPAPGSTAEALGSMWARVWGYVLVLGCLVALVGAWWTWWRWLGALWARLGGLRNDTGLLVEQVGLVAVGFGTVIYALGLAYASTPGRALPAALVAGLGLASFYRAWQIQRWVRRTIRLRGR